MEYGWLNFQFVDSENWPEFQHVGVFRGKIEKSRKNISRKILFFLLILHANFLARAKNDHKTKSTINSLQILLITWKLKFKNYVKKSNKKKTSQKIKKKSLLKIKKYKKRRKKLLQTTTNTRKNVENNFYINFQEICCFKFSGKFTIFQFFFENFIVLWVFRDFFFAIFWVSSFPGICCFARKFTIFGFFSGNSNVYNFSEISQHSVFIIFREILYFSIFAGNFTIFGFFSGNFTVYRFFREFYEKFWVFLEILIFFGFFATFVFLIFREF